VAAPTVALRAPMPEGVHIHLVGRGAGPEPMRRLTFMRATRSLFARLQPRVSFDVIHQLNPVDAGLSLALADAGPPVVLGPYVPAWPTPETAGAGVRLLGLVNRAIRAAQESRATALLLTTPAAATRLGRRPRRDVLVRELPHGLDPAPFGAAAPGTGDDGRTVLFLANLEPRKGIFVLLDAFEHLAAEQPCARLLIAGDGSATAQVQARAAASPHWSRIELAGAIARAQVPDLLRRGTVYCLPSFGEPFGMTALEAMASGRPLVVTEAGGLRHLVDSAGGLHVAPGDSRGLARALATLLADPGLRRAMGAHNQRRVAERYAWASVVGRLEETYAEAIAATRR
jgi:glycosyltransferase involved in cell wall biosynthesis